MGSNEKAVRAELRALGGTAVSPALFAGAVTLARALDETTSARDIASIHKELRAAIADLRLLADRKPKAVSASDDLAKRRAARLANASGS